MFNLISNHLKSICLRSMMHLCCKSGIHRRRSCYYVTYATVFIIFCLLVIAWMMILTQLSDNFDNKLSNTISIDTGNGFGDRDPKSSAEYLTPDLVESYRSEIVRLQTEIEELKKSQEKCASLMKHVGRQVDHMRRGNALSMSNEYEVMPFTHFTFSRIYPSSLALGKRVVEKPIGAKRREIIDILGEALKLLSQFNRTVDDFIEGIYSNDPLMGTQYHLFFRTAKKGQSSAKFYHKVTLLRPFSPPKIVTNEIISTQREIINLILPISQDRLEHLTQFLENIQRLARYESGRLKLFLVYFGQISQLKKYCCDQFSSSNSVNLLNSSSNNNISLKKFAYINATAKQTNNLISIKIIHVANDTLLFSRAKALHIGAEKCCKNSSLLFFCDVDLLFTTKFLERCRLNASKGKKVYYPILFSLYNPIYSRIQVPNMSNDMISPNLSNLISSQAGFWRDFGFGMTCQYKTDFVTVGGFSEYLLSNTDEQINEFNRLSQFLTQSKLSSGWGGEDVLLYRRHLQHPKLSVIRAIDPGLFHIWHQKLCNPNILTAEQYSSCLSTRALNEASHSQMAQHLMEMEIQKIKSSSN